MVIGGNVTLNGTDYHFLRLETSSANAWYLLSKTAVIDGQEYRIDTNALEKVTPSALKPFIVSAQYFGETETEIYGNPYLMRTLLNAYNAAASINVSANIDTEKLGNGNILYKERRYQNNIYYHTDYLYKLHTDKLMQELKESLEEAEEKVKEDEQSIPLSNSEAEKTIQKKTSLFKNFFAKMKEKTEEKKYDKWRKRAVNAQLVGLHFSYDAVKLTTLFYVNSKAKAKFNLKWEVLDLFGKEDRERYNAVVATRAKSIAQLRLCHDLSWFYDNRGRCKKDYRIVNTLEELQELANTVFPKIKLWAVDIESTGLNMFEGEVYEHFDHTSSIMLSWKKDQAIFIPIDMHYIQNIPKGWVEILKPWLEKIKAVGHNIGFDARGLWCDFKIKLRIAHDTMQLNFNINSYRAKFHNGLKYLEHKYFGVDTLELKDIFGSSKYAGLFRYLNAEAALLYACPDVDYCLQLFLLLWKELKPSCRNAYLLDMDTLNELWQLDCVGNRVDVDKATAFRRANNKDKDIIEDLAFKLVGQTLLFKAKQQELQEWCAQQLEKGIQVSTEEIQSELEKFLDSATYKDARYRFKISSPKELGNVMFNLMDYPIIAYKSDKKTPACDADVLKKLMDKKRVTSKDAKVEGWLKHDIKSAYAEFLGNSAKPLIKAKEFNNLVYPLALLVVEWRLRDKRNGTFFHQILDGAVDGMYYTSSKMANAETFRIINVVQTLQGFMKQLIIPFSPDYYMVVFDFSQIEYRFMAGMAKVKDLVKNLNRPRADFHKECCALLHNIKPYQVTSKQRKEGKSLNFAIPYGMGIYSICAQLFKVVNEINLAAANIQLSTWQEKFHLIWDYLEKRRDFALDNGYIVNELGRRRYFFDGSSADPEKEKENLEKWKKSLTNAKIKSIRRAAGNYPIQSGAADFFKIAFRNYRRRLRDEGLDELVKTTALIHDEMVNSVHRSVNKYYLYKIIYEEVMMSLPGHPRYFAGVSIVDNWEEGKEDLYEAPIEFVEHILNETDLWKNKFVDPSVNKDPKNSTLQDIIEYMTPVFIREYKEAGCDVMLTTIDAGALINSLEDYFIVDKLSVYYPLSKEKAKLTEDINKNYDNDKFIRSLEEFCLQVSNNEEITFIYPDDYPSGKTGVVTKNSRVLYDADGNIINAKIMLQPEEVKSILSDDTGKENVSVVSGLTSANVDDDLDLDETLGYDEIDDDDTNDDIMLAEDVRIDALRLYEMEELGEGDSLFAEGELYFMSSVDTSEMEKEQEDLINNPDKYIKHHASHTDIIRYTAHLIIINSTAIPRERRKQMSIIIDYLNNYAVDKDTLGAVEVVYCLGSTYEHTGVYVKGYDTVKIQQLVDSIMSVVEI